MSRRRRRGGSRHRLARRTKRANSCLSRWSTSGNTFRHLIVIKHCTQSTSHQGHFLLLCESSLSLSLCASLSLLHCPGPHLPLCPTGEQFHTVSTLLLFTLCYVTSPLRAYRENKRSVKNGSQDAGEMTVTFKATVRRRRGKISNCLMKVESIMCILQSNCRAGCPVTDRSFCLSKQ